MYFNNRTQLHFHRCLYRIAALTLAAILCILPAGCSFLSAGTSDTQSNSGGGLVIKRPEEKKTDPAAEEYDTNTLIMESDGSITEVLIDTFDKDYYSEESLKAYIQDEISAYEQSAAAGAVSLKSVDVSGSEVRAVLHYAGASDYSAFNKVLFVRAELGEGFDPGRDLPEGGAKLTFTDKDNADVTLGESSGFVVVTDLDIQIAVRGKLRAVSTGASRKDDNTAAGSGLWALIYEAK